MINGKKCILIVDDDREIRDIVSLLSNIFSTAL